MPVTQEEIKALELDLAQKRLVRAQAQSAESAAQALLTEKRAQAEVERISSAQPID